MPSVRDGRAKLAVQAADPLEGIACYDDGEDVTGKQDLLGNEPVFEAGAIGDGRRSEIRGDEFRDDVRSAATLSEDLDAPERRAVKPQAYNRYGTGLRRRVPLQFSSGRKNSDAVPVRFFGACTAAVQCSASRPKTAAS